jgi:hypothetical protein
MEAERWLKIQGYEWIYDVSDHGRVRRSLVGYARGATPGKILSPCSNGHYWQVGLWREAKAKLFKVSRLVAIAFVPNPENKPEVNHKNGNRFNDHYSNLEWVTNLENIRHAVAIGSHNNRGENNGRAKLTEADVLDIQALDGDCSRKELAAMYGVTEMTICRIVNNKGWKHV